MQRKVLVIENSESSLKLVSKLVLKAGLTPEGANSLTEARCRFRHSTPEDYLCAVVAYDLPDANRGEAIDFTLGAYIPTIVVTDQTDPAIREAILQRDVVDYLPKENHQIFDHLSRLLGRLDKNRRIGVLIADGKRTSRKKTASLMQRHNFMVYLAASQDEGLNQLTEHPHIQLMLVDADLDGGLGVQYVADLRKAFAKEQLSIIGIGDEFSTLLPARFLKSGANDFLRKPFCYEEFLCRIMQNLELMENVETIRQAAHTDYLTGLPNRRHFFYTLSTKYRHPLTQKGLAILDLDYFKIINDTYGHAAGDAVLKAVALLLVEAFPDVPVARFGGEEFCIFLPDIPATQAIKRLEAFRLKVADNPVPFANDILYVTTSIGLVVTTEQEPDTLLSEADKALYMAKGNGRNQVCVREA